MLEEVLAPAFFLMELEIGVPSRSKSESHIRLLRQISSPYSRARSTNWLVELLNHIPIIDTISESWMGQYIKR